MKTKTDLPSKIQGVAKFKKEWEGFTKMVDGASLILLISMLSEIEKKLKQMSRRKTKNITARKTRRLKPPKPLVKIGCLCHWPN